MKVALVNNYYYLRGGSERVLFGDQQALVEAGHEVSVFAPQQPENLDAPTSSYFPAVADRQASGKLQKIRAAVEVIYSPAVARAFGRFLDDYSPDIIHCHNIYGTLTIAAVLDQAKQRGIPAVLTAHDLKLVCPSYLGLRQGKPCLSCVDGNYWRCARYKCHKGSSVSSAIYATEAYFNRFLGKYDAVRRFLCPSKFLRSAFLESGIAPERAIYHPNALPAQNYSPGFEPGKYIFYAGRLSEEKGLLTLLEASAHMGLPLRIAGTGPLDDTLRQQISQKSLPVTMEGYQSGAALQELYRNAAFTVVPSEWYENASMAVLEAFAYGKPVLASNIGGNPELVVEGETGTLFSSGDAKELADAALRLSSNPAQLEQMGRRARTLIENRFSQERRTADLVSTYAEVLGKPVNS